MTFRMAVISQIMAPTMNIHLIGVYACYIKLYSNSSCFHFATIIFFTRVGHSISINKKGLCNACRMVLQIIDLSWVITCRFRVTVNIVFVFAALSRYSKFNRIQLIRNWIHFRWKNSIVSNILLNEDVGKDFFLQINENKLSPLCVLNAYRKKFFFHITF